MLTANVMQVLLKYEFTTTFSLVQNPDNLQIGGMVEIGGRNGILKSFRSGRASIDFNHALAGVTLRYKYKIIKEVTDRSEKVTTC